VNLTVCEKVSFQKTSERFKDPWQDVTLCGSEFQTETAEEKKDLDCAMVLFL